MRRAPAAPRDPDSADTAFLLGLRWLAVRELTEHQVRDRLARRGFSERAISPAIDRLTAQHALDDARTAHASARTDLQVHGWGPARIMRRLQRLGIDPELAGDVLREVLADIDQQGLLERALAKRLRVTRETLGSAPAQFRRLHAYLVRQGFPSSAVITLLRARARAARTPGDE
jgi:regulatory protein